MRCLAKTHLSNGATDGAPVKAKRQAKAAGLKAPALRLHLGNGNGVSRSLGPSASDAAGFGMTAKNRNEAGAGLLDGLEPEQGGFETRPYKKTSLQELRSPPRLAAALSKAKSMGSSVFGLGHPLRLHWAVGPRRWTAV